MPNALRLLAAILLCIPTFAFSQSADDESAAETEVSDEDLLTQAELENLVAPVALYPDTLLIQVLVASTNPMEVIKADRLLAVNEGEEPEVIQAAVDEEEWDESVAVLTTAFPEVVEDMALHIEWTEAMGTAMLAQTDDVMAAVQTMRTQAVNSGALLSNDAQEVEVTQDDDVIITPADPEVVYVPEYDPEVVYVEDNSNVVGDAIVTGLITYGTFTILDEIFDDDDDWDDYWGCRNCAGWGGGPIYRDPDIDIDVDGNVNIGNDINIGDRDRDDIDIGDRRPEDGWRPDKGDRDKARDKISDRRDEGGKTKLPVNKGDSRSDALRNKLSAESGAADISRPEFKGKPDAIKKTMGDRKLPQAGKATAGNLDRAKASKAVGNRSGKPSVKKPSAGKNHVKTAKKASPKKKPKATKKHSGGKKARKASNRGHKAGGRKKGGRR